MIDLSGALRNVIPTLKAKEQNILRDTVFLQEPSCVYEKISFAFVNWDCLCFYTLIIGAQLPALLKYVAPKDTIPAGAIVYGSFIQRLGLSSDGAAQFVVLQDDATGATFALPVKPRDKSAKENLFCYYLNAGQYSITAYAWAKNSIVGFRDFYEPIYSGTDSSSAGTPDAYGKIRYHFTVMPGTINYLGIWHFETAIVRFEHNKAVTDKKLQPYLRKIRLEVAGSSVPR